MDDELGAVVRVVLVFVTALALMAALIYISMNPQVGG